MSYKFLLFFLFLLMMPHPVISEGIFDVLVCDYTDKSFDQEGGVSPDKTYQYSGKTAAYVDIVGFSEMVMINGTQYVPGNPKDYAIIKHHEKKNPLLDWWGIGFDWVRMESMAVSQEGDTTKVEMDTLLKYFTVTFSTNVNGGKTRHVHHHYSSATFYESEKSPDVFVDPIPEDAPVIITEFNNSVLNHSLVWVPVYENTTKTVFEYYGETATRYAMIGEKMNNSKGVEYANYSKVEKWEFSDEDEGKLSCINEQLYILGKFDPSLLSIEIHTPYSYKTLWNSSYTKIDWSPSKSFNPLLWVVMGVMGIFIGGMYLIIRQFRWRKM